MRFRLALRASLCLILFSTTRCGGQVASAPDGGGYAGSGSSGSSSGASSGSAATTGSARSGSTGSSGGAPGQDSGRTDLQTTASKVDLLFDIDNSAAMGDKQVYLMQAIPDLLGRLVQPNCVDATGNPTGQQSDITGVCPG